MTVLTESAASLNRISTKGSKSLTGYYSQAILCQLLSLLILLSLSFQPIRAQAEKNKLVTVDSTIAIAYSLLNGDNFGIVKLKIDSLMRLASSANNQQNLLLQLKIRSLLGRYLLLNKEYDNWAPLYVWCKNQEAFCITEEEINLLVRLFNNAGIAFKRLERYSESEEAYLKASESLRKLKNPDFSLYGSIYANAGNALRIKGEFDRSIEYLEQSVSKFNEFVETSKSNNAISKIAGPQSDAMINLGLVYQSLTNHQKAIEVFKKCIEFKLQYYPQEINDVYSNLVISLIEVRNYHEGKKILEKMLIDYKPGIPKDLTWAMAKLNLADIDYRLSSDINQLFHDLDFLNKIIKAEIPAAQDIGLISNHLLANVLKEQGDYEGALRKWSEAMKLISSSNQDIATDEIPYDIKTLKFNKLIELMNLNAQIFYDWGKQKNDSRLLIKAEKRYAFSLKLIDSLRNTLELQSSKIQVSKMQRATLNALMEMQYKAFKLTNDSAYIDRLFSTMEQSKSAGLWSDLRKLEFKTSQIPETDLQKENAVNKKVSEIQGRIIEANAAKSIDQQELKALLQENHIYNQQLDSLKLVFREKYPDYFSAKFDRSTISLKDVCRQLTTNQILIEYAVVFGNLYTITITSQGKTLSMWPISERTKEDISFVLDFMKGRTGSMNSRARTKYCESASNLYSLLISSSLPPTGSNDLIIIPDSTLCYIPFEALLEPQISGAKQDYRKLPYLIRNHTVYYGLTATVFFHKSTRQLKPSRRILAVAPSYDLSVGSISDYIKNAATGLPELKGTIEESKSIKKMLGGRLLTGQHATESEFKRIAPKYGILHLAMHSIPDKNNSFYSSLVFTPGADITEDGVLFTHEVYNLSLNSSLTVLSACETGSGQMVNGEGVLSFGRAFFVAGCPNLIMTMWTVDDQSSQKIMISFYRSLLSGVGIASALQQSKLGYLKTADQLRAHPHFWAGFIELGQNQILNITPKKVTLLYLLPLLFIASLSIVILLKKKK